MTNKKSIVAVAKENEIQDSVTKVFDLLGGVNNMLEPNATVVIKPNAGHANPPESSVCTNPEVLRAVIREVKKANPKRIIVAEAAAIGCDTIECFKVSGIEQVAVDEGVELIDIKRDKDLITVPVRNYKSNIKSVKLPRFLLEAEHIINLPILKAHASMVFSGALKNIKGTVQDKVHLDMHRQNLAMAMMDVWYAVRADINIVDIINPAGGYGPHTPVPLHVGCILGSYDPVAADLISCDIVGIDTNKVDYFKVAAEAGFGTIDRENIEVIGKSVEEVYTKMWIPYIGGMNRWPEYNILAENACSSCQALLSLNMEELKAIDEYEKNSGMTVVIGRKDSIPEDIPKEKLVLHGNCTRKWKDRGMFIEGCPPAEPCLYMTISDGKVVDGKNGQLGEYCRPRMAKDAPVWQEYVNKKAEEFYKEHGNK
ncbi:DUF362 domain-containing protein [Clostridium sp. PL3]|uniref:DUF362 domain-containing protein n=2 Tax=Clostridium thailandense TaxID=2794346 RepID=A0A949TQU9_9CLOT|nr:DUF362 domain-containing protein [Clostridium thailandense]